MSVTTFRLLRERSANQGEKRASQEGAIQALGFGGLLAAGGVLAFTALELPLICPLRLTTGIPCPFCGMTTGTVALLRGDLGASVSANPFAPGIVLAAIGGCVDGLRRFAGRESILRWLARLGLVRKLALPLLTAVALISWVFQLFRFDVL